MNKGNKSKSLAERSDESGAGTLRRATISQAKNNLSALIDLVRHGESILIFDRDKPVARLVPVAGPGGEDGGESLARLERAGLLRRGMADPRALASEWEPVRPREAVDILAVLREDRQEDWR